MEFLVEDGEPKDSPGVRTELAKSIGTPKPSLTAQSSATVKGTIL
jgi:hypothetical protein